MDTAYTLDLFQFLNGLHAYPDTFLFLFILGNTFHLLYDLIRDIHAGDLVFHIFSHTGGFQGRDPAQDIGLFSEAPVPAHIHPFFESLKVVDTLCLDKIGPRSYLLCQTDDPECQGIGKGVCGSSYKQLRRLAQRLTSDNMPQVPHLLYCL